MSIRMQRDLERKLSNDWELLEKVFNWTQIMSFQKPRGRQALTLTEKNIRSMFYETTFSDNEELTVQFIKVGKSFRIDVEIAYGFDDKILVNEKVTRTFNAIYNRYQQRFARIAHRIVWVDDNGDWKSPAKGIILKSPVIRKIRKEKNNDK